MKALTITLTCMLFFSVFHAQDNTYSYGRQTAYGSLPKIAIVPFDTRHYLCDINKEIGNRTGLTLDEIENTFRNGIIQSIIKMSAGSYDFFDPEEISEDESFELIGGIYSCISYDYVQVVPLGEEDYSKAKKILKKLSEKESPTQINRGAYLEDGQIKEWYDGKERFMNARITDMEKFKHIVAANDLDMVLCINELDIKVMRDYSRDIGQVWPRRIKIHFTIFDKDGNQTFGSAVYYNYDGHQKDIYTIIRKNFRPPCAQIVAKLETAVPANQKKRAETTKKKKPMATRVKPDREGPDEDF